MPRRGDATYGGTRCVSAARTRLSVHASLSLSLSPSFSLSICPSVCLPLISIHYSVFMNISRAIVFHARARLRFQFSPPEPSCERDDTAAHVLRTPARARRYVQRIYSRRTNAARVSSRAYLANAAAGAYVILAVVASGTRTTYAYTCEHTYVRAHVCEYIHTHIYIYIYIYISWHIRERGWGGGVPWTHTRARAYVHIYRGAARLCSRPRTCT